MRRLLGTGYGVCWRLLVVGSTIAVALLVIALVRGVSDSDSAGRIPVPGEDVLELDAKDYGVFFEEAVRTDDNETYNAPEGVRIRARGLDGAPDPEVDLGGLTNQISLDDSTAEEIGKLRVAESGRYAIVVGRPREPTTQPQLTLGTSLTDAMISGGIQGGIVFGVAAVLALGWAIRTRASGNDPFGSPTGTSTPI